MSIVKCGEKIRNELSRGWSRKIEHDFAGKVTFPVFIDCVSSKNGTTNTEWRVTTTPLTRRLSTRHWMPESSTASVSASNRVTA
jgi:hypothetical protein